jgi:Protein of unknown function (DUF2505)
MRFRIEQRFASGLAAVEAALVDPAFISRLATLPKMGRPTLLDQNVDGSRTHQRVRYAFVGDLSGAVRAVVDPNRLTWVEDSVADSNTHLTTFEIVPDHYANLFHARGTFELRGAPVGCTRSADGDVGVKVPLLGRKVEAAIVSGLREHADLEVQVMDEWLPDH